MFHKLTLIVLYLLTISALTYLLVIGTEYYGLDLADRPHSLQHEKLRPSGSVGHGIGMAGSGLMLLLLLYSVRKRWRKAQRWGNIRYWLNYHIWMGITGPLLVIFHTAFKFGGIVAVSFWSMIAVALSGVLGRYLYLQIPRNPKGEELSDRELGELDRDLLLQLREMGGGDSEIQQLLSDVAGEDQSARAGGIRSLWVWLRQDLSFRGRLKRLTAQLRQLHRLNPDQVRTMVGIVKRRVKLRRRIAYLSTARSLLHQWHIVHRPFAVVMLVIMMIHVAVTIAFGYRWVFGGD